MEYATKLLTKINVWYDGLEKKWKSFCYMASVLAALFAAPLGLTWLAVIWFLGIFVQRAWYIWNNPGA